MLKFAKSLLGRSGKSETELRSAAQAATSLLETRIARTTEGKRAAPVVPEATSIDTRAAERFVPKRRNTVVTTAGGKKFNAQILNVSSLSVAIQADFTKFVADEVVAVGSRRVTPGRKIMLGWVFMLEKPLEARYCQPDLVL